MNMAIVSKMCMLAAGFLIPYLIYSILGVHILSSIGLGLATTLLILMSQCISAYIKYVDCDWVNFYKEQLFSLIDTSCGQETGYKTKVRLDIDYIFQSHPELLKEMLDRNSEFEYVEEFIKGKEYAPTQNDTQSNDPQKQG